MPEVFLDYRRVEVPDTYLRTMLPDLAPGHEITLDTEASGLYVDGDYEDAPPARVSLASLAWRDADTGAIRTLAIPFDQGKIGGKPGKWDASREGYETLPHTDPCLNDPYNRVALEMSDGHALAKCKCAPYNFGPCDWDALCLWLASKTNLSMHHKKYDCHIMNVGLREAICEWVDIHVAEYDAPVRRERVYGHGIDLMTPEMWDTMLAQGVLEPLHTSALKPTARRLWGIQEGAEADVLAEALKRNGVGLTKRYDLVAWDVIGPYAAKDAELTLRVKERHNALIDEGAVDATDMDIIEQELKLSALLYKMELRGVGLKADDMRAQADKMRAMIRELERQLPFQPPTEAQAKVWFFETNKVVPIKVTDTCKHCRYNIAKRKAPRSKSDAWRTCQHEPRPSLDAEVVARLAGDKVPGAEHWALIANCKSALSKWYVAWPFKCGKDGRIRTNFRQGRIESDHKGMTSGGAISGRLSAERVQLQGVPQDWRIPEGIVGVKKLFKARDRHQLWELDLSNAEVRVGAWVSRCKKLADRINSGENIHDANTKAIFGITEDDPRWNQYRTSAKRGIFGRFYGAGIRTLKMQIDNDLKADIPQREIQRFMDELDREYPEIQRTSRAAQRKVTRSMGGCGYVRLANGRKRVFGAAEHTHKAFNAVIQGGVAEIMKLYMLEIEAAYPGALVNQVHDSVWLELDEQPCNACDSGGAKGNDDCWACKGSGMSPSGKIRHIQEIGERLYERYFSTDTIAIRFTVDAKRLA